MTAPRTPAGLDTGGRSLWRDVTSEHPELDATQLVQLTEVCRAKDRLDKLDAILTGSTETWCKIVKSRGEEDGIVEIRVSGALMKANETANVMKMLIASLRLPDQSGRKPQARGARGAYGASAVKGDKVGMSSLERLRTAKTG